MHTIENGKTIRDGITPEDIRTLDIIAVNISRKR